MGEGNFNYDWHNAVGYCGDPDNGGSDWDINNDWNYYDMCPGYSRRVSHDMDGLVQFPEIDQTDTESEDNTFISNSGDPSNHIVYEDTGAVGGCPGVIGEDNCGVLEDIDEARLRAEHASHNENLDDTIESPTRTPEEPSLEEEEASLDSATRAGENAGASEGNGSDAFVLPPWAYMALGALIILAIFGIGYCIKNLRGKNGSKRSIGEFGGRHAGEHTKLEFELEEMDMNQDAKNNTTARTGFPEVAEKIELDGSLE